MGLDLARGRLRAGLPPAHCRRSGITKVRVISLRLSRHNQSKSKAKDNKTSLKHFIQFLSSIHELAEDLNIQIVAIKLAESNALLTALRIIPKCIWATGFEADGWSISMRFILNPSYDCVGRAINVLEVHLGSSGVGSIKRDGSILVYSEPDQRCWNWRDLPLHCDNSSQVFQKKFRELPSVVGLNPARGQHLNFQYFSEKPGCTSGMTTV